MSQQILPSMYIHSKAQQLYIYMQVNTKTEYIIKVHSVECQLSMAIIYRLSTKNALKLIYHLLRMRINLDIAFALRQLSS